MFAAAKDQAQQRGPSALKTHPSIRMLAIDVGLKSIIRVLDECFLYESLQNPQS